MAIASISSAGSLKMMRPATIGGRRAIAVTRSSGRLAGLNAARSSHDPALINHERGGLALRSRDPLRSARRAGTLGIVGKRPQAKPQRR